MQMSTQSNSTKKSFHVSPTPSQNQTLRLKFTIIGEEIIATTSTIYLAVQTLYNSAKPLGAALKKLRFSL